MRAIWTLWGAAGLVCLVACGQPKPANDATKEGEETLPPPSASASTPDPASEAPKPQPTLVEQTPPPTSSTPYDKDSVEVGLKRAARQVKANCGAATDEDGKATGPWGKTTVSVKLGHNGHSQGATVGAGFDGKPVGKCITQAFAGLIFPPFAGPDTTVDWEVEVVKPNNVQ